MKMGCICSSPHQVADELREQRETNKKINADLAKAKQEYRSTHRLLLLGKR